MRLFILTSLLALTTFAVSAKEYSNCKLESIDFKTSERGHYVFNCDGSEKRFPRHRQSFERELIETFNSRRTPFFSGKSELQVDDDSFEEQIIGFTSSEKFKKSLRIRVDRRSGQVSDLLGSEILKVSPKIIKESKLVHFPVIKEVFHDQDRVIVQRSTDTRYINTMVVIENCFPKSCGQTTYITLRKSANLIKD